jgi:hypothetical protein
MRLPLTPWFEIEKVPCCTSFGPSPPGLSSIQMCANLSTGVPTNQHDCVMHERGDASAKGT